MSMLRNTDTSKLNISWNKSLTNDEIGILMKYRQKLDSNTSVEVGINESFLVKTSLKGSLYNGLTYQFGLFVPLKTQTEEHAVLIDHPFFLNLQYQS